MGTTFQNPINKIRKPKLPRKRKKACIKAQGRMSYRSTIHLAIVDQDPNCKFWVNSKVINKPVMTPAGPCVIPTPTEYW